MVGMNQLFDRNNRWSKKTRNFFIPSATLGRLMAGKNSWEENRKCHDEDDAAAAVLKRSCELIRRKLTLLSTCMRHGNLHYFSFHSHFLSGGVQFKLVAAQIEFSKAGS